jgi:hypothetical protein
MSGNVSRDDVVEYLRSLADDELARLFYEAMFPKNVYRRHPDGTFWNDVYVVGTAMHTESGPAEVEVLAVAADPSLRFSEEHMKRGALEQGRCEVCKTFITSTFKVALCPVCGTEVECT